MMAAVLLQLKSHCLQQSWPESWQCRTLLLQFRQGNPGAIDVAAEALIGAQESFGSGKHEPVTAAKQGREADGSMAS